MPELHRQLPEIDLRPVPLTQAQGARDLHMLRLPVHERAELVWRILYELLLQYRKPLGIDHFPADVVESHRVRRKIEGVVLPHKLRLSEGSTVVDALNCSEGR